MTDHVHNLKVSLFFKKKKKVEVSLMHTLVAFLKAKVLVIICLLIIELEQQFDYTEIGPPILRKFWDQSNCLRASRPALSLHTHTHTLAYSGMVSVYRDNVQVMQILSQLAAGIPVQIQALKYSYNGYGLATWSSCNFDLTFIAQDDWKLVYPFFQNLPHLRSNHERIY